MAYELPPLPYDHAALEPYISEQTMQIHHDRYHLAYIERVNPVLEGTDWADKPIEEVLRNLDSLQLGDEEKTTVRNQGGGHYNHSLFWEWMTPGGTPEPGGDLGAALDSTFGSFSGFQEAFMDAGAKKLFGAGWAWLVHDGSGLEVIYTANQDNPVLQGKTPILGVDVWEHAFYPQYLARRDYIEAWWNVVNWPTVERQYGAVK